MLLRNVVDQFHDHNGFAYAGAAEHTDLTALSVGADQVDNLNACFQDFGGCGQFLKRGGRTMDIPAFLCLNLRTVIHHVSEDVEDSAQCFAADRNGNALSGISHGHTALQTVCGAHCDAADRIVSDMLRNLNRQRMIADRQGQGVIDGRQRSFRKMNVYHRSHDLRYDSRVHLIQSRFLLPVTS